MKIKNKNIFSIKKVFFYTFILLILIILISLIINIIKINKRNKLYIYHLLFTKEGENFLKAYKLDSNKSIKFIPSSLYIFLSRLIIILVFILYLPILLINQLFYTYNLSYFKRINYLLEYPLKHPFFYNSLECAIETSIKYKNDLIINIQRKLYWNKLFIENNVKTPQIVGIIDNNKLILDHTKYSKNKEYIIKYDFGGDSSGIKDFDINNIPLEGKYIVQERIRNKNYNGYIRIVTIRNKENKVIPLLSYLYILNKSNFKNNITAGRLYGGVTFEIDIKNKKINKLFDHDTTNDYLINIVDNFNWDIFNNAINDCIKLHNKINYSNSVSWDIIVKENTHYLLEGNVPGLTVHTLNKNYFKKTMEFDKYVKYFY